MKMNELHLSMHGVFYMVNEVPKVARQAPYMWAKPYLGSLLAAMRTHYHVQGTPVVGLGYKNMFWQILRDNINVFVSLFY